MKKNVRNILSAVLAVTLLAVLLVIPAMAEGTAANTVTDAAQLRNAVAKGGAVVLGANIDIGDGAVEIDKPVVLELNGKTLSCPGDTKGDGVFHVVAGGKLTINGDGTVNSKGNNNYSMAIWADGGEVIINGGTYTNKGCKVDVDPDNNHYDLIYVKNGGSVSIHGGTFECEIPKWTLNSHDSLTGTFKVHGGVFMGYDPTNADTEPGDPANWMVKGSTCTAVGSVYNVTGVAAIGNAQYATLQSAINAANAGETITLLKSEQLSTGLTVAVGKQVTLDLNGYTLSGVSSTAGSSALIQNNGDLTINDSSEAKTGKITTQAENPDTEWEAGFPAYANNTITNCGTLTINGGRIENITGEGFCVPIDNNSGNRDAILVVNGGEIVHTNGNVAVRQFANSATYKNSVTVNDGLLEGKRAVWIQLPGSDTTKAMNAELTVNGGTLRSTDKGENGYNLAVYSYTYGNSFANTKLTIKGGTIDGDIALTGGSNKTVLETVSVTGGTFLGKYGVYSYGEYTEGFISGGSFAAAPEDGDYDSYLADGYSVAKIGDVYNVHKHNLDFVKPNDATCTEDGNKEHYHCSVCGMNFADEAGATELKDVVVPAGHAWGDWVPKKDATCTEDGHEDHFCCSVCGLYKMLSSDGETYVDATEKEVIIPSPGHKLVCVEAKPSTCTGNGNDEYWYCETCSGEKIFADKALTTETTLEKVTVPAGHNYTSHVYAKDATCIENGYVEYWACNDCLVVEIVTENGRVESTQDKAVIPAKGHTMTKVETKTPTCTGDGNVEYYNCSVCKKNFADEKGEKELTSVVEAAKGHKLTKVDAKAATCTEAGVIAHYNCSACEKNFADEKGEKELTSVIEAAKGHKLTKVEAKAATYTEAGNIEHYACACGKLFADAEGKKEITDVVIPQLIKVEEEKAEVSEGAVDNALADAKEKAEETGKPVEVIIEVPKAPVVENPEGGETGTPEEKPEQKPQEVVKVELPVQALENVAKEEANLTVVMPSVTVTVDTDALNAVTEQAAGNTVTLVVEQVKEETLTEKQQEAVKKYDVAVTIKAEFICQETNEKIWTEDNNTEKQTGSVTVKMPFTPAEGSQGSDYTVLYIADDGSVKEIKTSYEDGNLVFALEHFSEYVVVNTKTTSAAPDTGVSPDTGDRVMLAPVAVLLVLSVMGMAVMTAGKKKLI